MKNDYDLADINRRIVDRGDVFYWQTDRRISPEIAGRIFADRHAGIDTKKIIDAANQTLSDRLISVSDVNPDSQNSFGNVNSVCDGVLESGTPVIIRIHPRGIKNGYFYAESAASDLIRAAGLPSYKTYMIHENDGGNDTAFQIIEKLPGSTAQSLLKKDVAGGSRLSDKTMPELEQKIVYETGRMMAKIHKIKTNGFGPFDNRAAKNGELIGLHKTFESSVLAGLEFNFGELQKYEVLNSGQIDAVRELFAKNPLLQSADSVLVHNDFVDWNMLSDGEKITGIIDLDECVSANPVSDIACYSTFWDIVRMEKFLAGYFSVTPMMKNFDELFQLLRMRYVISKMTLRVRRLTWDNTEFMREKIRVGTIHLHDSLKYFKVRN